LDDIEENGDLRQQAQELIDAENTVGGMQEHEVEEIE